jgi:hypothetical protein
MASRRVGLVLSNSLELSILLVLNISSAPSVSLVLSVGLVLCDGFEPIANLVLSLDPVLTLKLILAFVMFDLRLETELDLRVGLAVGMDLLEHIDPEEANLLSLMLISQAS